MYNKGIPCWGHINKQCVIQQRVVTYINATLTFMCYTYAYVCNWPIYQGNRHSLLCWSRYSKFFKAAVNFFQVTVTVTIALASSAVNDSKLNLGSDICCTYACGHIFGGLSESFLSLAAISRCAL